MLVTENKKQEQGGIVEPFDDKVTERGFDLVAR